MPNIVTGIGAQNDSSGNLHLEVTGDDGATFEALLPLEMWTTVRTTILRKSSSDSGQNVNDSWHDDLGRRWLSGGNPKTDG